MGDNDDTTNDAPPENAQEQLGLDKPLTVAEKLAQADLESPTVRVSRELLDSPAAKLARDFSNSPAQQFARRFEIGLGPAFDANARMVRMEAARRALELPRGLSDQLAAIKPMAIDKAKLASLGALAPGIDASVIKALQGIQPLKIDLALGRALQGAQRSLDEATRPLSVVGSAIKQIEEQHRATQKLLVASLAGPMGGIARTGQWASAIGKSSTHDIVGALGAGLGSAVEEMRTSITRTFVGSIAADQAKMSALLGLDGTLRAELATTRLRMSALAGIGGAFDLRSSLRLDAYHSLFGEWRSRPDLPDNFWRDKRVRRRMYREAEVDDGLVTATPGVALEVMIESGLVAGVRSDASAVGVITLGEISMTVRSRGTRQDAYAALDRFERELRAYVGRKLEERFGADWFKARASNLIGKAKTIRRAAMERGEAMAPLIEFVELGELAGIILNKKNWDEVFGDIFINRAEFDHDMQKMIATRRPTMHIRTIDGVRLVEMLCVMQRLAQQMTDDGAWKIAAESDR